MSKDLWLDPDDLWLDPDDPWLDDSLWLDPDELRPDPAPGGAQEPVDGLLEEYISLWQLRAQIKRALGKEKSREA